MARYVVGVPYAAAFGYNGAMTKEQINAVLETVRSWPQEDQEELVEVAREIERGGGGPTS
jgi:hypothetical protein